MQAGPFDTWKLWRLLVGGAEDTPLATIKPSILAHPRAEQAGVICVRPYSEIAIRGFGTDANNETFGLMVFGAMENGPLQLILDVNAILGASQFGASEAFLDNKSGGNITVPAADYFEVDTWTLVDNLVGAVAPTASATFPATHLRIPTLGYKYMQAQLIDKDGATGVEAMSAGIIWRPTAPRLN